MTETVCDCPQCRAMCQHSACVPTPQEARDLIRAGYAQRLRVYRWPDGCGGTTTVVAPAKDNCGRTDTTNGGACTFYRAGLCELHGSRKPLEGRIAHHTRPWMPVRLEVLKHWRGRIGESVAKQLAGAQ